MTIWIERLKDHVKDYKVQYACGATAVVSVGITCLVMRGRYATLLRRVDGLETMDTSVTVRPLSFFANQKNEIVTTIHNGTRGHPGFVVRNFETDRYFGTQAEAAKSFDINPSNLSQHLNGRYSDAEGWHFERVPFADQ